MKIPYLRSKAQTVIAQVRLRPGRPFRQGADQRAGILSARRAVPDRRCRPCASMPRRSSALVERPRVRALVRVDQFDRFVSVIVFVPRDRYDSRVREKIGDYLKTVFDGRLSAYYPAFPEGGLARVHFIIGRSGGKTPKVEPGDARRRRSATSSAPGRTRCARRPRRPAPTTALVGIAARFPESYRGSLHGRRGAGRCRRASPRIAPTTRSPSTTTATPTRRRSRRR